MAEINRPTVGREDSMVQLSVPGRFYPSVLQYLGELYKQEVGGQDVLGSGPEAGELPVVGPGEQTARHEWNREDVRRLKSMVTNPTILAIFDLAREREGGLVSIRELERHTGRKHEVVRADLGGLTRTCRTRLKKEHWPFAAIWAADGEPQMSYKVRDDVLQWWWED
jgi:hypothetical protein